MRGIRSQLKKWLEVLTPPPPREDTYLRKFAELLSPFMKGLNPNPPPPPPPPVYEPVNFRFLSGPEPAVARDDRVQTEAVFSVKLSDQAEDDRLEVIVGTEFQITEDDRDSGDSWGYSLTVVGKDSGAVREGNNWRLMLVKDREVKFSFKSDPYSSNYTGRLKKFAILEDVIKGN
jgi:hypothetical protein